ncbi:hypothetical protein NQ317_005521 [Molorchus minor]|uniref:Secreted protein n=1 Tax=Molorchus minor TaxID=1323400 RepID=A0ABQ9J237_9CUCU|nr:hypothetical protein NQ317_005521 [Molorchus minor]
MYLVICIHIFPCPLLSLDLCHRPAHCSLMETRLAFLFGVYYYMQRNGWKSHFHGCSERGFKSPSDGETG